MTIWIGNFSTTVKLNLNRQSARYEQRSVRKEIRRIVFVAESDGNEPILRFTSGVSAIMAYFEGSGTRIAR